MALRDIVLSSEIEAGRYVALKTRSAFGGLIRLFCKSPYDHVIVAIGNGQCVQATLRGVKQTPLAAFRGCQAVVSTDPTTLEQAAGIVSFVRGRVGNEYAFPLIGVIALRKLGLRSAWLIRVCRDNDAEFCSELAVLAGLSARPPKTAWLCGEPSPACVRPDEMAALPDVAPVAWT